MLRVLTSVDSSKQGWIQTTCPACRVRRFWLLVICLAWGGLPVAAGESGEWSEPSASTRLVFNRPRQESFCLLAAPAWVDGAHVAGGKALSDGGSLPVRVAWTNAEAVTFLVDCRDAAQTEIALYLLTNRVPACPDTDVIDPRPVRFFAQRTGGQDLPETWEQLQMLDVRVDGEPTMRAINSFDLDAERPSGWNRGDWQRKNHLIQLSGWVLLPAPGRMAFSVRSDAPMWLLVDDALAAQHGASERAQWTAGQPLTLPAGLHHVVLRGATRHGQQLAAEWTYNGRRGSDDVKLVTGGDFVRSRLERRDRSLQVLACATCGKPYTFEGITNVFVPVRLETLSPPWSVNTLAQLAGIASLADAPYIRRTVDYVVSESSFLAAELAAIPGLLPHPSAANYLLVEVKKGPPAGILRDLLLEKRILIRSCANFAGLDDSSFRVAVRTRGENEILLSALREIFVKKNG